MIHIKKNFLKFLFLNLSFTIFTYAVIPTNQGFQTCLDGMVDTFGYVEDETPIAYIKIAITHIMIGDNISPDALGYYKMFSKQALSTGIQVQDDFCNAMKLVFGVGEYSGMTNLYSNCMNDLHHFGNSKDDILEVALYHHRVEVNRHLATQFRHWCKRPIDDFGVLYLGHIRDKVVIDPESSLVNAWTYCVDKHPDENQENAKTESEASSSQLGDSVVD